jgi:hypothetical protein
MRKPKIKSGLYPKGVKSNRWRAWDVTVDGKVYHHQSKESAYMQYDAAKRLYKKKKMSK